MKIDSLWGAGGCQLDGSSPPMNIERDFIDSDAYKTYAPPTNIEMIKLKY